MANPRARVYWKQAERLIHKAEQYIGRYDTKLDENLTTEQYDALIALQEQMVEVLNLLPDNTPV